MNDNFGRWRSDFHAQVEHCLHDGVRGQPIVELLKPDKDDYFVLKPKHSGFFSTTLDMLLESFAGRDASSSPGLATNICVLFTANDAYMRGFRLDGAQRLRGGEHVGALAMPSSKWSRS